MSRNEHETSPIRNDPGERDRHGPRGNEDRRPYGARTDRTEVGPERDAGGKRDGRIQPRTTDDSHAERGPARGR